MTKSELVYWVEALVPRSLVLFYRRKKRNYFWHRQQWYNRIALKRISKKKGSLNVAFLVNYASIWKYDSVFRMMQQDSMFHPFVLICPCVLQDEENKRQIIQDNIATFTKKGYEVYSLYNESTGKNISLSKYNIDILFYTRYYANETDKQYDVYHTTRYLKCYVNYGYNNVPYSWGAASPFHGLMWRHFIECDQNRRLALSFEPKELQNAIVTGYPMYDEFMAANGDTTMWKNSDRKFKRIIWAPHHTVEGHTGMLQLSTFMLYADYMLQLAEEYKNSIQFVFKPHPILKSVLYRHPNWGKEKTDAYYEKWAQGKNTTCVYGSYTELFISSDAMIHDCGSFTIEYLYTKKPCMYLATYDKMGQSNEVAKKAFNAHYHGYNEKDIRQFIDDVVLGGNDDKQGERSAFFDAILLPPNGCSVAENILYDIKKALFIN